MALNDTEGGLWFVYFVKGNGPRPDNEAELQAMQKAHLQNMADRFYEGRLIAAGPVKDPTGFRRGICVLTVGSKEDVPGCFAEDPFVQYGLLDIQFWPWGADPSTINTELPDPDAIAENRLATVTQTGPEPIPNPKLEAHQAFMNEAVMNGSLAIAGPLIGESLYQEVVLIAGSDEERAKESLGQSPLVSEGLARYEIIPLWMARDTLARNP